MSTELTNTALRMAIVRRRPSGTLNVHADRGGQFESRRCQRSLRVHGFQGSMGGVASAGDNAASEPVFSLLQKSVLNRQPWNEHDQLRNAIITWVESTYKHHRRQRALGKLTPAELEALIGYRTSESQREHTNQMSTAVWADPCSVFGNTVGRIGNGGLLGGRAPHRSVSAPRTARWPSASSLKPKHPLPMHGTRRT